MKFTNKTITALFLLGLISVSGITNAAEISHPNSTAQVQNSLNQQRLSKEQVIDLFDPRATQVAKPVSDLEFFAQLRVAPPPSNEGLHSPTSPGNTNDDMSDIINSAYSPADLISQALEERQNLPLGRRIVYLKERATDIIRVSGARPTEILLRLTLNRSVDLSQHVLPILGYNNEELARMLANFYRENFELAASFGNNKIGVESRFTVNNDEQSSVAHFLRTVSIAEYGRIYASLLWRYSQGLTSDSAKAVIMMRLIGYLGWDFNADLRRREKPIAQTIADVYTLQHSPLYQNLLNSMAAGQEPSQAMVAEFRSRVFTILQRLPSRLQSLDPKNGVNN